MIPSAPPSAKSDDTITDLRVWVVATIIWDIMVQAPPIFLLVMARTNLSPTISLIIAILGGYVLTLLLLTALALWLHLMQFLHLLPSDPLPAGGK